MSVKKATEVRNKMIANLNVTELESRVILPLYHSGNMTAGGIALVLDEPLSKVERALKRLAAKGLVKVIDGITPVYAALSPGLAIDEPLRDVSKKMLSLEKDLKRSASRIEKQLDKATDATLSQQQSMTLAARQELDNYESSLLNTITTHLMQITNIASDYLGSVIDRIAATIENLDQNVDSDLGDGLLMLQKELDKSQKKIVKDTNQALTEFKSWLSEERTSASVQIKTFHEKASSLIDRTKQVILESFEQSNKSVQETLSKLSSSLHKRSTELVEDLISLLHGLDEDLIEARQSLLHDLIDTLNATQKAFDEIIQQSQMVSEEEIEQAKEQLNSFIDISIQTIETVDTWKADAYEYLNNMSRTLNSQVEQISKIDQSFVDTLRTTITGHMDRVNDFVNDYYGVLSSVISTIDDEYSQHLEQTKSSILSKLRDEVAKETQIIEKSIESLQIELNTITKKTSKGMENQLKKNGEEIIDLVLQNTDELATISTNFTNRIKTTVHDVITKTKQSSTKLMSTVINSAEEFESKIDERLNEVISEFSTITSQYSLDAEALYNEFNAKIDAKLTSTIRSLTSHINKTKKSIESVINEKLTVMDDQALTIRDNFHSEIMNITEQLVSLIQSVESTFDTLLTNQLAETRELINSIYSEFKSTMRSESTSLKDYVTKLKQKYVIDIEQHLSNVRDTSQSLSANLDEFAHSGKQEMFVLIRSARDEIEETMQSAQTVLQEVEEVTVKKMGDELSHVLDEFRNNAESTKFNMSERIASITDYSRNSLDKTTRLIIEALESTLSEQSEIRHRSVSDISQNLDQTTAKLTRAWSKKIGEITSSLSETKKDHDATQIATKNELFDIIDERRKETTLAINAASMTIRNLYNGLVSQVDTTCSKLSADMQLTVDKLKETSDAITNTMIERSASNIEQILTIHKTHLERLEGIYKAQENTFAKANLEILQRAQSKINEAPDGFAQDVNLAIDAATSSAANLYDRIRNELSTEVLDIELSTESIVNEFSTALKRISDNMIKGYEDFTEQMHRISLLSNQQVARKFESIGIELKSNLSNRIKTFVETADTKISEIKNELDVAENNATAIANTSTAEFRQKRNEILNRLEESTDKIIRDWATEQKKDIDSIYNQLGDATQSIRASTDSIVGVVKSINEIIDELKPSIIERTWHLAGVEEIRAHIASMAKNAKESILISVTDLKQINVKQLNKAKQASSRILIVPYSDELDPDLSSLTGWRIWQTYNPVLLTVIDDAEILVGGATDDDTAVALISQDKTYLQLYHDVIGPRLIRERIKVS